MHSLLIAAQQCIAADLMPSPAHVGMSLCRHPKRSTMFLGSRLWPSGRYTTELTADGQRWWLGTFETANHVARVRRGGLEVQPYTVGDEIPRG
jgi:hypothetical protein